MNDLMNIAPAGNLPAARTIPEIEADILAQKRTIGASIVFIGRALEEAKGQLDHGQWGRWLRERVNFSQSSAENYMRIAREFGEGSGLLSLPYSKVLALLPVPKEERETFAAANDIEDKSVAQIKQLIRERDEAKAYAETQRTQYIRETQRADALAKEKRLADQKIRELENRKPERVTVEVAPEDYKKVMAERHEMEGRVIRAEEEVERTILERNEMLSQMTREIASAEEERDAAIEELEAERMAGSGADPLDVTPFCDACAALLNKLYAAPHSGSFYRTKSDVELERYAMNVQLIMKWSVETQDVIERIRSERSGEECIFSIT